MLQLFCLDDVRLFRLDLLRILVKHPDSSFELFERVCFEVGVSDEGLHVVFFVLFLLIFDDSVLVIYLLAHCLECLLLI